MSRMLTEIAPDLKHLTGDVPNLRQAMSQSLTLCMMLVPSAQTPPGPPCTKRDFAF